MRQVWGVLFAFLSSTALAGGKLPTEIAAKLLEDPLFLYPASRERVRRWTQEESGMDAADLVEILDPDKLSDRTFVDLILLAPPGTEDVGRKLVASLAGKAKRPSLYAALQRESERADLTTSQRYALLIALADKGNRNRKAALPLAERLIRENVPELDSDPAFQLVLDHLDPARLNFLATQTKGRHARSVPFEAAERYFRDHPSETPSEELVKLTHKAFLATGGPRYLAIQFAADFVPKELAWYFDELLAAGGDIPDLFAQLKSDAVARLTSRPGVSARLRAWANNRLEKDRKELERFVDHYLDRLDEPDRAALLEKIVDGPLTGLRHREAYLAALARVGPEARKRLFEKALTKLEEWHRKAHKKDVPPPRTEAIRKWALSEFIGLEAAVPSDRGAEIVAAQLATCSDEALPFPFPSPVRLESGRELFRGKWESAAPWRLSLPSPERLAHLRRHRELYAKHARGCLSSKPLSAQDFCFNIRLLGAVGGMDYGLLDLRKLHKVGSTASAKWSEEDERIAARCVLYELPEPKSEGDRAALKGALAERVPRVSGVDDAKQDEKGFEELEHLTSLLAGRPLEAPFHAYVDGLMKKADPAVSACDMVCKLRASTDKWKTAERRTNSEFREAPTEQSFAEDNLWAIWDRRSAPLCGAKPLEADRYLSELPYSVRGRSEAEEKRAIEAVKRREAAVGLLTVGEDTGRAGLDLAKRLHLMTSRQADHLKFSMRLEIDSQRKKILDELPSYPGQLGNSLLYSLAFGKRLADELDPAAPSEALKRWKTAVEDQHAWALTQYQKRAYHGNSVFSNYAVGLVALNSPKLPTDYLSRMKAAAAREKYECTIPYDGESRRGESADPCEETVFRSVVYYEALSKHETSPEGKRRADEAVGKCLTKYGIREAIARAQARRGGGTHLGCSRIAPYYYWGTLFVALDAGRRLLACESYPKEARVGLKLSIERLKRGLQNEFDEASGTFTKSGSETYSRRPAYVNPLLGLAAASLCESEKK